MRVSTLNRKIHRWGAILTALPVLIIVLSGMLLQLKKETNWIQPPTCKSSGGPLVIGFDRILEIASGIPEADVSSWDDIDRLDMRPGRGIVKVRPRSRWEIQIDMATGEVLQVAYRRSDIIESIHDGTFFHSAVKLWVFLPVAVVILALWCTGIYLFLLPHLRRR